MAVVNLEASLDFLPYVNSVLHSEISSEIRMRQESDYYLSRLINSADSQSAVYVYTTLENYRRMEWAAEVVQVFPESVW